MCRTLLTVVPANQIVQEAMAVRGHGDEIDLTLLGEANQLVGRIAHRQLRRHA